MFKFIPKLHDKKYLFFIFFTFFSNFDKITLLLSDTFGKYQIMNKIVLHWLQNPTNFLLICLTLSCTDRQQIKSIVFCAYFKWNLGFFVGFFLWSSKCPKINNVRWIFLCSALTWCSPRWCPDTFSTCRVSSNRVNFLNTYFRIVPIYQTSMKWHY